MRDRVPRKARHAGEKREENGVDQEGEVFVRNNLQNNGRAAPCVPIHGPGPTPDIEITATPPRAVRIKFRTEGDKRI
jgi:hypothetical protein